MNPWINDLQARDAELENRQTYLEGWRIDVHAKYNAVGKIPPESAAASFTAATIRPFALIPALAMKIARRAYAGEEKA